MQRLAPPDQQTRSLTDLGRSQVPACTTLVSSRCASPRSLVLLLARRNRSRPGAGEPSSMLHLIRVVGAAADRAQESPPPLTSPLMPRQSRSRPGAGELSWLVCLLSRMEPQPTGRRRAIRVRSSFVRSSGFKRPVSHTTREAQGTSDELDSPSVSTLTSVTMTSSGTALSFFSSGQHRSHRP